MIKKILSSDAAAIGMWAIYLILIGAAFAAAALAGGGVEQNMAVQKSIEVIVQVPEDDWKDYLVWLVPGVIVPIVLFWLNKRRK